MSILQKLKNFIIDKDYRFIVISNITGYKKMPNEKFLKRKYNAILGEKLDLDSPKTFNEKLQWVKLHHQNPQYTVMADKYLVRNYIRDLIGEEYLIPLIGVWDSPDEINFDTLPKQFVLKCNHNSGKGMCICKDKDTLNIKKVKKELKKGLSQDYYIHGREWPYKNIPRKIIAEQYMKNGNDDSLIDYKFQFFNGTLDHIFVCKGRNNDSVKYYYFDSQWNYLPYTKNYETDKDFLNSLKPKKLEEMLMICNILAKGIPEIRIDLYEINGKVYFGELTFFSQSGFDTTITREADLEIGNRFKLVN